MTVRIQGEDIPMNKRVEVALTVIYGIGKNRAKEIAEKTNTKNKSMGELTETEISAIILYIENSGWLLGGDLRAFILNNIKELIRILCYRGIRHKKGLPVHGQRTKTNARTCKGPRKTVPNKKKAEK